MSLSYQIDVHGFGGTIGDTSYTIEPYLERERFKGPTGRVLFALSRVEHTDCGHVVLHRVATFDTLEDARAAMPGLIAEYAAHMTPTED